MAYHHRGALQDCRHLPPANPNLQAFISSLSSLSYAVRHLSSNLSSVMFSLYDCEQLLHFPGLLVSNNLTVDCGN